MTNEKAIIIKGLSKEYYKRDSSHGGFFSKLKLNKSGKSFFALNDINLEINKGEVIGIIGPNGAGKSTLLKILAEVTPPTTGSVEIFGKVASILEIGIGFQPELSGYENIFLSGKLYGLSQKQILSKLDKIIEMFGFPDFINTEVKHYSSGMYMRLAFSIIINIEANIYLFDEILSVGDAAFQMKALNEIKKISKSGHTVLIVTHVPKTIYNICNKMIFLSLGTINHFGNPNEVMVKYQEFSNSVIGDFSKNNYKLNSEQLFRLKGKISNDYKNDIDILSFHISNLNSSKEIVMCNEEISINMDIRYSADEDFKIGLIMSDHNGTVIISHLTNITKSKIEKKQNYNFTIPKNTFNESKYSFDVLILNLKHEIKIGYRNIFDVYMIDEEQIPMTLGYINLPIKTEIKDI